MTSGIALRAAAANDSSDIWIWRNDPHTRAMFRDDSKISWETHQHWFTRIMQSPDHFLYVAELDNQRVSVCRFDKVEEGTFEVSVNVDAQARGKGIGVETLRRACQMLQKDTHVRAVLAEVKAINDISLSAFRSAGFDESGERDGYILFNWKPAYAGHTTTHTEEEPA